CRSSTRPLDGRRGVAWTLTILHPIVRCARAGRGQARLTARGWMIGLRGRWVSVGQLLGVQSPNEVLSRQVSNPPTGVVSVDEARRWVQAQTLPRYRTSIEARELDGWSLSRRVQRLSRDS